MRIKEIITFADGKKCVEFEEDYYTTRYNFLTDKSEYFNTFRLDRKNLLIRIENLKKYNLDYSVEQSALSMLIET